MDDSGLPSLEKRGFIRPGYSELVLNSNDHIIPELVRRVVTLDWFLSRDSAPVTEDQLKKAEAPLENNVQEINLVLGSSSLNLN